MVLLVAHRTLSDAPCQAPPRHAALGFFQGTPCYNSPDCPVCTGHVRWGNGGTVTCANGRLQKVYSARSEVRAESQNAPNCPVRHRTVRCRKKTEDFNGQLLQTPMVCWRGTHRTVNSVLSGAPSTATTRIVVGAINNPNHLHSNHPSFLNSRFNTRVKDYTPKHIQ
jgi:hypothetical protein